MRHTLHSGVEGQSRRTSHGKGTFVPLSWGGTGWPWSGTATACSVHDPTELECSVGSSPIGMPNKPYIGPIHRPYRPI